MNLSAQDAALLWTDVVEMARDVSEEMLPWLERLSPVSLNDGTMLVSTRQNWTERKVMGEYRPIIENLLREITLEDISLEVVVETATPTGEPAATVQPVAPQQPQPTRVPETTVVEPTIPQDSHRKGLSPAALAGLEMKEKSRQGVYAPVGGIDGTDGPSFSKPMSQPTRPSVIDSDAVDTPVAEPTPTYDAEPPTEATGEPEADNLKSHVGGDFTFDTYVVGEANEIAYKMARAVAEQPGSVANPLFIHGPSGYGKTHLLLSIVDYIEKHTRGAYKTLYVAANTFVEQYVDEIHVKAVRGESVMRKYREADVLLVDDVQMFANKQDTMSMFFDLFNLLILQGKQIVLAADRAPDYLELDPRMKTRFGQGLVVDIKAPTYEMKWAILKSFYERSPLRAISNVEIPDEAFGVIAEIGPENPRVMQGLITSLIPAAESDPSVLTRNGLREFIGRMHKASESVDISTIARKVGERFGVDVEALRGKSRTKNVSDARQVVMWLTRQLTDATYEEIGRYLGGRDHATVSYGINAVEKKSADQGYSYMLTQLKQSMAG